MLENSSPSSSLKMTLTSINRVSCLLTSAASILTFIFIHNSNLFMCQATILRNGNRGLILPISPELLNEKILYRSPSIRPIYVIGHMANSIKTVNNFLDLGANAIEADVTFASNGTATKVFHGLLCDCFRNCLENEDFEVFLRYLRSLTEQGTRSYDERLTLLLLDLKMIDLSDRAKAIAGEDVAYKLINNLFTSDRGPLNPLNVILGLSSTNDVDFVQGFKEAFNHLGVSRLHKFIGWDVGKNENIDDIFQLWHDSEVGPNIWQGDGITNCLSPARGYRRLTTLLENRNNGHTLKKVYRWTVDLKTELRESLGFGVDGIITNQPNYLRDVLQEYPFTESYRIATKLDNPWERIAGE